MGHSESSDGSVMSDSNDCLVFSISIRWRTISISCGLTCVGTKKKYLRVMLRKFNQVKKQSR